MELDKSFYQEEVRWDFVVTEKRKKVWAAEMEILEKFDEVCRKHNLTYFAYYGTLLGAVRHHGFIPWDDDIDVAMLRDDYERLKLIASEEFREPYFFQSAYTDEMVWPFSKVRDSRTTAVEFLDMPNLHQGMFIDIFPLDDIPKDENDRFFMTMELQKLLWCMITDPDPILSGIENGRQTVLDPQFLMEYMKKDIAEQFKIYEEFNLAQFGNTEQIGVLNSVLRGASHGLEREWFQDVVYLPFETMQIPVPVGYDQILTGIYGNYHEMIMGGTAHEGIILDPDIPYKKFFENIKGD